MTTKTHCLGVGVEMVEVVIVVVEVFGFIEVVVCTVEFVVSLVVVLVVGVDF